MRGDNSMAKGDGQGTSRRADQRGSRQNHGHELALRCAKGP